MVQDQFFINMSSSSDSDSEDVSMSKLMNKIKNNPKLMKKFGLEASGSSVDNAVNPITTDNLPVKRKNPSSPLKLKKFKKVLTKNDHSVSDARSPDVIGLVSGASNAGASISNRSENNDEDEENLSCVNSESDEDELSQLENILNASSDVEEHVSASDDDFEIIGDTPKGNWSPSKKILDWYLKVADLELNKDLISKIHEEFKTEDSLNDHFQPPKLPPSLWSAVQSNSADSYRLKSLYKSQELLYLSIKPLLSVASTCSKDYRPNILKSIQLICATNLNLNRYRRTIISPHLKSDLRKNILSLPVKHDSVFGEEFSKTADNIIKEQSAMEKVLAKKSSFHNASSYPYNRTKNTGVSYGYNKPGPSHGYNKPGSSYDGYQSFRGRGSYSSRGRGRGRRGSGRRGGNSNPFNDSNKSSSSKPNSSN